MKSETLMELGRELNREIVEELKQAEIVRSPESYKELRKQLNKERIQALGLVLIPGGKYENKD